MRTGTVAVLLLLSLGCQSEYPPEPKGGIKGTVSYSGTAAAAYKTPTLVLYLIDEPTLPDLRNKPEGLPRAMVTLNKPDFASGPVPYDIPLAPPTGYKLLGQLVDFAWLELGNPPKGGYPDYCALLDPVPEDTVTVDPAVDLTGINFTLYDPIDPDDQDSIADPCFQRP
jgi:hypothetical protein